jgi:hypothetical protein
MTAIHSSDWDEFTQAISAASQAGQSIQIQTSPETAGAFLSVFDGEDDEFEDTSEDDDDLDEEGDIE